MTEPRRVRTQVERDADGTTWRHHAPGAELCTSSQPWICTPADCPGCFNPHCWVVDGRTCRSGCDVVPHDQLTPDQLAAIKEQMAADMRAARERFLAGMATGSRRALIEPDPDIWVSRERQGPRPSPPLVAPIHPEEPVTPTAGAGKIRTEYGVRLYWDDGTVEDMPRDSRAAAEQTVAMHAERRINHPGWKATASLIERYVTVSPWIRVEEPA